MKQEDIYTNTDATKNRSLYFVENTETAPSIITWFIEPLTDEEIRRKEYYPFLEPI